MRLNRSDEARRDGKLRLSVKAMKCDGTLSIGTGEKKNNGVLFNSDGNAKDIFDKTWEDSDTG